MRGRYGPAQAGQNQEKYGIPRFAKTGVKQYPLIDCHKGTSAVEKMMSSDATRKKFISDAVAKMKEQKFQGYNLDIELGAPAADGKLYAQFVGEFGKALHAAGGKLRLHRLQTVKELRVVVEHVSPCDRHGEEKILLLVEVRGEIASAPAQSQCQAQ